MSYVATCNYGYGRLTNSITNIEIKIIRRLIRIL